MFQLKQIPPVTKNLLIINCLVFLAQFVLRGPGTDIDLTELCGLHFVLADNFHWWQLVTYMFLHSNFTHLFFNMFSLWMFGRIVEQTMTLRRYLLFYFVCGIGAALCQELWQIGEYLYEGMYRYDYVSTGEFPYSAVGIPMGEFLNRWTTIGASGACYGILLAYGMTFPNERILLLLPPIPIKAKYFVIGYAVLELFSAFFSNGNVAHFAHLGGMLFGWGLLLYWRRHDRHDNHRFTGWETWTPRRSRTFRERWRDGMQRLSECCKKRRRKEEKAFKDRAADYDYNAQQRAREKRIDDILDKVKRNGYQSLSEEEKKILFDNSQR
jgi:membrane associated rhomboid family serine protease